MSSAGGDRASGRHEAESVAGGTDALLAGPAATASKGSNGEVSSGVHPTFTTSEDTLSCEPSISDGDVEPHHLPDGQAGVPVVVGLLKGWYYVQRNKVSYAGRDVTPTQFECAGGRELSRKWRSTIRVLLPDGTAGKRLGHWLRDHGYDTRPPPAKRKRSGESGARSASAPSSPVKAPLSPAKSPRLESRLDRSLPGSPCCPHCSGCLAAAKLPPAAVAHAPCAAPHPVPPHHPVARAAPPHPPAAHPAPARHPAGYAQMQHPEPYPAAAHHPPAHPPPPRRAAVPHPPPAHHPPANTEAIRRSLEAFLASLPPSAQAALGSAVGGGAYHPSPMPPPPPYRPPAPTAPPIWQQQGHFASPPPPPRLPASAPARPPVLSPLSSLRTTFHRLAGQQTYPAGPSAAPPGPQQHWPQPPPQPVPPCPYPQQGLGPAARDPLPKQAQQQQLVKPPQQLAQPQQQVCDPPGDAAHYMKANAPAILPRPREHRRRRQLLGHEPDGQAEAAVDLADCMPVLPGWEGAAPALPQGPPLGPAGVTPPSAGPAQTQSASPPPSPPHSPGCAEPFGAGEPSGLEGLSAACADTPMHWRVAAEELAERASNAAAAAVTTQQRAGEGAAEVGEAAEDLAGLDLEWLMEGAELDLAALLGQESPEQQQAQQQQASPAGRVSLTPIQAARGPHSLLPQHHAPRDSASSLTPSRALAGGASSCLPSPSGEDHADLLADLLRSVLPSPGEGAAGGLPSLLAASPHGALAAPLPDCAREARSGYQQQQEKQLLAATSAADELWDYDDLEFEEGAVLGSGAAAAAVKMEPGDEIGGKQDLPTFGSAFDLKVFAGVAPPSSQDGPMLTDPAFGTSPGALWLSSP